MNSQAQELADDIAHQVSNHLNSYVQHVPSIIAAATRFELEPTKENAAKLSKTVSFLFSCTNMEGIRRVADKFDAAVKKAEV